MENHVKAIHWPAHSGVHLKGTYQCLYGEIPCCLESLVCIGVAKTSAGRRRHLYQVPKALFKEGISMGNHVKAVHWTTRRSVGRSDFEKYLLSPA